MTDRDRLNWLDGDAERLKDVYWCCEKYGDSPRRAINRLMQTDDEVTRYQRAAESYMADA